MASTLYLSLNACKWVGLSRLVCWKTTLLSCFIPCTQSESELCGEGVVVGCYDTKDASGSRGGFELTECAKELDLKTHGKLLHLINM